MAKRQRLSYEELMGLRTAVWDIETGGLDANFDPMICVSIKRFGHGKKVQTFRNDRLSAEGAWDDRNLCWYVASALEDYDVLVHHYGDRFDLPFIQTRLLKHEIDLVDTKNIMMVDTWWTMRNRYKFARNTLAAGGEFLDCEHKKTPLSGDIWLKAKCGVKGAIDYVVKHNIADVLVLEELTKKLAKAAPLRYRYWR